MLKRDIDIVKKNGIYYLYKNGKKIKDKPWLGDLFSFLYDSIMAKSVFPKKFDASIKEHTQFLKKEYSGVHNS